MSYCLNPYCTSPHNPDLAQFCIHCGFRLLLGDRYRALQPIGRGGFGKTFLAVDEYKPSRPKCVIKQFFPQRQEQADLERSRELFRREAIQLERLGSHPQIPELLAHFEQDQYHYLVQEYIEGQNLLQEVSRQGAFSDRQVWELLNDLLPVLEYVHQHQVIHRDIKPQNIIRRRDRQQYVLVDFGAAKSVGADELARTGTSIGSPEFVPPEQTLGKATYASDLYSLGVTCLYLLTGVRPAELYDTEEGAWNWQPRVAHSVPSALGQILDRLLQGAVRKRYSSAAEVLHDLHQLDLQALLNQGTPAAVAAVAPISPLDLTENLPDSFATTQLPPTQAATFPEADLAAASWVCRQTLTGHRNWVRSVLFHPTERLLLSGSGDKTLCWWRLESGELVREVTAHDSWVRAIALSPDGSVLASASNDRTIKLWNCATGDLLQTLTGHHDWVRAVIFSPDGQLLFSGSQDKTIRLWRATTGQPLTTLEGHDHWVVSLACLLTPSGKIRLFSGSRDTTIGIWSGQQKTLLHQLKGHTAAVNALALTHDGKLLISGSDDGTIRLWDWQAGRCLQALKGDGHAVYSVALSSDGQWLLSCGQDTALKLWHLPTRTLQQSLGGHQAWVWSVAFSPDGATIASGSWDTTIKLWQRETLPSR